jgi:hypothetical protein
MSPHVPKFGATDSSCFDMPKRPSHVPEISPKVLVDNDPLPDLVLMATNAYAHTGSPQAGLLHSLSLFPKLVMS